MVAKNTLPKNPIPITLLSGFLGSGKTTLLERILTTEHGYKIAVIINDISQLNIDAALIQNHKVTQKEEKLIQLQNGCICCTLRGDLLEELCSLATSGEFQYIVIESTGISEPMQVAETFTTEFSEMLLQSEGTLSKEEQQTVKSIVDKGGLHKLCQLDTCVTVIDALNFLDNFETTDFLADRYGDNGQGEAERTITDLMVDQIEFADVIIVNKIATIKKKQQSKIMKTIKSLNPVAKVHLTNYCQVPIKEVINTGLFDFEKSSASAGWLQSLNEMTVREGFGTKNGTSLTPKPETEEYGISNFVYRARKPFHPERIYELLNDKFVIIEQAGFSDDLEDTKHESEEEHEHEEESEKDDDELESENEDELEEDVDEDEANKTIIDTKKKSIFGPMLRSKGFFWLATRYIMRGEWSSAGTMMTLRGGIPWFSVTGTDDLPSEAAKLIKQDMQGKHGDRRNEIVFIGVNINKKALAKALDECLLTDDENEEFEKIVAGEKNLLKLDKKLQKTFNDGFEEWIIFDEEEEQEDQHEHNGKEEELNKKAKLDIHVEKHGNHSHVKVGPVPATETVTA